MTYRARLFALLALATFFEGFDTALASLVLPLLGREFEAGPRALGGVLSLTGAGMMASLLVIRLADRVGRRPVLLAAVGGFAVFTLATAFAPSLAAFGALQLVARMMLVTELALAYVMLGEELPAERRGRANALLGAFASVGASLPALFLAPLEAAGLGWRGLFAIGALPLALWPVYWRSVRETPAFARAQRGSVDPGTPARRSTQSAAAQRGEAERSPIGWRAELRAWAELFAPALRARLAAVSALWWSVNFWSATALYFFTLYAFEERGWSAPDLQRLPLGTIPIGFAGYFAAGWIMDRVGRRAAATLYLAGGTAAAALCFQSSHGALVAAGYFALVGLGGLWTIAATITTELFPTQLRATAIGLANNLIGRTGLIAGPIAAGSLAEALGSTGDAVTWLACANLLCIPIVWLLPETRGAALDP